jgi:hypothetical protein
VTGVTQQIGRAGPLGLVECEIDEPLAAAAAPTAKTTAGRRRRLRGIAEASRGTVAAKTQRRKDAAFIDQLRARKGSRRARFASVFGSLGRTCAKAAVRSQSVGRAFLPDQSPLPSWLIFAVATSSIMLISFSGTGIGVQALSPSMKKTRPPELPSTRASAALSP